MPISSSLKLRNKSIKATYAVINGNTVQCKKNVPITPFTPIVGLNGVPFKDAGTGALYYEYFVDPSGAPLPAGLTIGLKTGEISGTPTVTTTVSLTTFSVNCKIGVRDSRNKKAFKESVVTFIIVDDLVATPTTGTKFTGVVNKATADIQLFTSITGGRLPYVFTVTAGVLPAGVTLDQTTGKLTGKPTETKRTFTDASQTEVLPITPHVEITVTDFYNTASPAVCIIDFDIIDVIIATPTKSGTGSDITIKGVIPLAINYHAFSSVVAGTPPYTYIKPAAMKDAYPAGLSLSSTTGDLTGTYSGGTATKTVNGSVVPDLKEFTGTLQVAVEDSDGNISSKISKVNIVAYLPFEVVANANDSAGLPKLLYDSEIEFRAIGFKPLKAQYGVPPYTFTISTCKYTNMSGTVSNLTAMPAGSTLTSADGTINSTAGLAAGTYEFNFNAVDSSGTSAVVPKITVIVSNAVVATSLATTKSFEYYIGDTSAINTGVDVLSASLGIPPYTFSVLPALPAGLSLSTTATKCTIIGTATEAADKAYVVSVKDSTGMSAILTETINLKIISHLTSTANITDIEAFLGDLIQPVDIFDSITGGVPPYTVKLLTGTLRPELSIVAMNFTYYDTAQKKEVTTDTPQLWGNVLITGSGTGTPILGADNIYGYASQDTYTFSVSDSKGETSPNIATLNFKIYKKLRGAPSGVPPTVTGIAKYTTVNFQPITPIDGVPPYTINITKSITDRSKKPSVKTTYPSLGLKTVQPDTIAGVPTDGYKGYLYYYLTDKMGSRTDNIPVSVNITPAILAVPYTQPVEVMYVKGFSKFEITDKSGSTPTITTPSTLKLPFFKSITGGLVPYVFYESDSTGVVIPKSALPTGFYIDSVGNLVGDSSSKPSVFGTSTVYCKVIDGNMVSGGDKSGIKLTINDELTTELVDNVTENAPAVTSFNNTKSNTTVVKTITDTFTPFKLVKGKNGSGRYSYMFDLSTVSTNPVLDYFQINGTTGEVKLKNVANTTFTDLIDVTFGIKVTDTFTGLFKVVSNVMNIKVVNKLAMTAIKSSITYDKDSVHTDEPIFTITGGSGLYDFVSCVPTTGSALPATLSFNATGGITGSASVLLGSTTYTVTYKDRVYNKTISANFTLSITSDYIVVPLSASASGQTVDIAKIKAVSLMSSAQLLSTPIKIRIDINGNVRSSSVTVPALYINIPSGLHPSTTIKLLTKTGNIIGKGGKGGVAASDPALANGESGGPAVKLNTGSIEVTVESLPGTFIAGGGGGGGAGSGGWTNITGRRLYAYMMWKEITTNEYYDSFFTKNWSSSGLPSDPIYNIKIDMNYSVPSALGASGNRLKPDYMSYVDIPGYPQSVPWPGKNDPTMAKYRITSHRWKYAAYGWDFDGGTGFTVQAPGSYTYTGFGGGKGGNGFGYDSTTPASTNGANGVLGVGTSATAGAVITDTFINTIPPAGTFDYVSYAQYQTLANQYANGGPFDGAPVKETVEFGNIVDATPGDGVGSGLPGATANLDQTSATAWKNVINFGGGGGGGYGSPGGDGGYSSSTPTVASTATKPAVAKIRGIGGYGGAGIITTSTTQLPTLLTASLVYGEVY